MRFSKKVVLGAVFAVLGFMAFAYNPPVQGENMTGFINPFQITSGFSTAGGPLFNITPAGTMVNPGLAAYQNRTSLDIGYTAIVADDDNSPYGHSFGTGIIVPTKWCNFGGEFFGIWSESYKMCFADSANLKLIAAKEVAENFAIGVGLGAGYLWGYGEKDWSLVFDAGAVYKWGELGPMKNFRLAASVLNAGKVYNKAHIYGIKGAHDDSQWSTFPGFLTMKAGAAAEFINQKNFVLGLSVDVTTPFFQNFIIDAGVEMHMLKFIILSSSWEFNMAECVEGKMSWLPTVGLTFKFALDTSFTKKDAWQKSDMQVGAAYKNVHDGVNVFSAGAAFNLGQPDRQAPSINVEANIEEE